MGARREGAPNPELPKWPGASVVYSRAYEMLGFMACNGHVQRSRGRGGYHCHVSDDMNDLIDALNKGDEQRIKGLLHNFKIRGLHVALHKTTSGSDEKKAT